MESDSKPGTAVVVVEILLIIVGVIATLWIFCVIPFQMSRKWAMHRANYGFQTPSGLDPECAAEVEPLPGLFDFLAPGTVHDETREDDRGIEMSQSFGDTSAASTTQLLPERESDPSRVLSTTVIIRGQQVPISSFPWTVTIGDHFFWPYFWMAWYREDNQIPPSLCTGALIKPEWILTAAHCVNHYGFHHYVTAGNDCMPERGGILYPYAQVRRVRKFHLFKTKWRPGWSSKYSLPTKRIKSQASVGDDMRDTKNDIALLKVDPPFELSENVQPIKLATIEDLPGLDLNATYFSGWGMVRQQTRRFEEEYASRLRAARFASKPIDEENTGDMENIADPEWPADILDDCRNTMFCIRIRPNEPATMGGDSGCPWVAKPTQADGSRLEDWRLIATGSGECGTFQEQCNVDELEDSWGREEPIGSHAYNWGVRVPNQEKINWIRWYIPDILL